MYTTKTINKFEMEVEVGNVYFIIVYLGGYVDISLIEKEPNLFVEKISHVVENGSISTSCRLLQ